MVGTRKQILMVDDDKSQLLYVNAILKNEYDIISVTSGKDALECLGKTVPSLVLLDVLMPEMDGFEAYGKMRALSSMKDVPIIFLTSVNAPEEIERALRIGAADYITKPYTSENFTNRIRNAIRMYEYKKAGEPKRKSSGRP